MSNGNDIGRRLPFGWHGLSPKIPQAVSAPIVEKAPEALGKMRYAWFGETYRGDAATPSLLIRPNLTRLARFPRPTMAGDIKESKP